MIAKSSFSCLLHIFVAFLKANRLRIVWNCVSRKRSGSMESIKRERDSPKGSPHVSPRDSPRDSPRSLSPGDMETPVLVKPSSQQVPESMRLKVRDILDECIDTEDFQVMWLLAYLQTHLVVALHSVGDVEMSCCYTYCVCVFMHLEFIVNYSKR